MFKENNGKYVQPLKRKGCMMISEKHTVSQFQVPHIQKFWSVQSDSAESTKGQFVAVYDMTFIPGLPPQNNNLQTSLVGWQPRHFTFRATRASRTSEKVTNPEWPFTPPTPAFASSEESSHVPRDKRSWTSILVAPFRKKNRAAYSPLFTSHVFFNVNLYTSAYYEIISWYTMYLLQVPHLQHHSWG